MGLTYHSLRLRLLHQIAGSRVTWKPSTTNHTRGWSTGTYTCDGATRSGGRGYLRDPHQIRQLDLFRTADLVRKSYRGTPFLSLSPAGAALRQKWAAQHPEVTKAPILTPAWIVRHRKEVQLRKARQWG